jgi:hypothetical protein
MLRRGSFSLSFRQYPLSPVSHTRLLGRERFDRSEYSYSGQKVLQEPTPAAHVFSPSKPNIGIFENEMVVRRREVGQT